MDTVILAKDIILNGKLGKERPNDNQMIFGGTGSGKSMSILYPTLSHMKESSLIGTFAKEEVVLNAIAHFQNLGYKTHLWNLGKPKKGDKIPDPLSYVNSDADVQELAKQIVNGNEQYAKSTKIDPYWVEAAESLMTGLIYYVLMKEKNPSMKNVIDLFYQIQLTENGRAITSSIDSIVTRLKLEAPDAVATRKLKSFTMLPYVTATCVRDQLEKSIQNTFPISIQNAMSKEAYLDFEKFATERTAIFILTSPVRTAEYSFANLLFSLAIRHLMEFAETIEGNHLPRNVKLMFDDFSCGFPIKNFEKSISTFRAAGISCLMLCQSLSQLDATYGEANATVILDNCSSLVYLPGGMNQYTASYISRMMDLPMNDIMFMPMGNVIVFQTGHQPIIAQRYETLKDPNYQEMMSATMKKENKAIE